MPLFIAAFFVCSDCLFHTLILWLFSGLVGKGLFMYFNPKDFGKRLHLARKMAGLTQQALADKVSVERKHISHLECGERCCSIDLLVDFSEALGVSTDYLLKGSSSNHAAELDGIIGQLTALRQKL